MTRNFGLDLMRATAILMVLSWHSMQFFPQPGGVKDICEYFGFTGVELFFVLSGFLIGGILIRYFAMPAKTSLLRLFWSRRWIRTLPNYYVFWLINLLLAFKGLQEWNPPWPYLIFTQNLWWPIPGFFGESWSLAVEEWFYLLLPLGALVVAKFSRRNCVFWAALLLALVSVALRAYFVLHHPHLSWRFRVRKIALARFDSMLFGVALAQVHQSSPPLWRALQSRTVCGLGLAALIALFFAQAWLDKSLTSKILIFPLCSAAFAMILPRAQAWHSTDLVWWRRLVEGISLTSYSVYLINEPLLLLFNKLSPGSLLARGALCVAFLILTFWLAQITYRQIEQRFLSMRDT